MITFTINKERGFGNEKVRIFRRLYFTLVGGFLCLSRTKNSIGVDILINLIGAHGMNREIGANNELLWKLPKDMEWFKYHTIGHTVVMGRKTFESIGKPLKGRENIVLTRDPEPVFIPPGVSPFNSTDSILQYSKDREIYIIGGAEVYKAFLPLADRLFITMVEAEFPQADSYFPEYLHLLDNYSLEDYQHIKADNENPYDMRFIEYKKKNI